MKNIESVYSSLFLCILFILLTSTSLFAEAVFLKDGSIVEGKIIKETDRQIIIKQKENKQIIINRKQILRTLFNNAYKIKVYVHKMDESIIEGYVVDETNEYYVIRKNLKNRIEMKILKNDVNGILKSKKGNPTVSKSNGKKKSVAAAVITSIFPVYSGSWNTGFKSFGLFFVIFKSGFFALTVWYGVEFIDYVADPYLGWPTGKIVTALCALTYACFFIGDAIYSAKNVKHYNREISRPGNGYQPEVKYAVTTRTNIKKRDRGRFNNEPDGVNISAVMLF